MVTFSAKVQKFNKNGEKTGWTYILIEKKYAEKMNPGCKKSFRVKGLLDDHKIQKVAILPMGEGDFILAMNGALRKGTGKSAGDTIKLQVELDEKPIPISADLLACLKEDARANAFFKTLTRGHQTYFSNWIESAKTIGTKTKRITLAVIALAAHQGYGEMIRANTNKRQK